MKKIISLQNSGESIEKTIALIYTARQSDPQFYDKNSIIVYYGHNLPKKSKKIMPHGTVGFYEKYLSGFDFNPVKNDKTLIADKNEILQKLLNKRLITEKNREKLNQDDSSYLTFIRLMPMDVVYKETTEFIRRSAEKHFKNVSFRNIYLEENYTKYYASLEKEKWAYSIYSLDYTGTISKFFMPELANNNYSLRNLMHMFGDLDKKSCLSGNSAMFLAAIKDMTRNMRYEVGYREHKREFRRTRNFELESILKARKGVIEPKNTAFNNYFNNTDIVMLKNMEEKANKVIATVYKDFLNECMIK